MPAYSSTRRLKIGIGGAFRAAFGLACVLLAAPVLAVEQTTALMVTPFHEGRVVHGDDGKDHVEYDLLVVNVFSAPITLKSVAIVDGAVGELMRVEGTALAEATQSLLDQKPIAEIPASGAAAVEIDLIVAPGAAPDRVSHRIAILWCTVSPTTNEIELHGDMIALGRKPATAEETSRRQTQPLQDIMNANH